MLAAHADYVRTPLPAVEQQREGQPRPRTHLVMLLELRTSGFRPSVIAVAPDRDRSHIAGWVVRPHPDLDRMLHQGAQRLAQCVRRSRLVGAGGDKPDYMLAVHEGGPLVAMLGAEPIDDIAIGV